LRGTGQAQYGHEVFGSIARQAHRAEIEGTGWIVPTFAG